MGYGVAVGAVTYNWLVDDGSGNLAKGGAVQVATPTFTYFPPAVAAPAQVQAVIAPPPPPAPPPKEFGPALWVKEIRTTAHNNKEVKLRDLVSADPADPQAKNWKNGEQDEVEVEWQVLQKDNGKPDGGVKNNVPAAAEALPNGDEVVTRRYEFYKYTGPLDNETGEALAEAVAADGIHGVGVKTINGVSVDLSTLAVVGDFAGAQMAAAPVAAPVALADHVCEGQVNAPYVPRTLVIQGSWPFVAVRDGALPAGMSFDEVTGILSGTPTQSGTFSFRVTASDGVNPDVAKNYTLLIAAEGEVLPPSSLLDTTSSPVLGGTTTGDGAFAPGTSVTVNATANPGYHFVNWTDNDKVVSTQGSYTFTIDISHSVVAHFALNVPQRTILTSVSVDAGGTTSGGGVVDDGTTVTVVATPNLGYAFTSWTENGLNVSSSASYAFVASSSRTLVANFTPVPVYTVTAGVNGSGGSASGGGSYSSGTSATVTATPDAGYVFMRWTVNGTLVSTSPTYTFNVTANRTVLANFIQTGLQQTITTSASPAGTGITTGGGIYASGDSATVTATANPGYAFGGWKEGNTTVSNSRSYTFIVGGSRNLVAKFNEAFVMTTKSSPPFANATEADSSSYKSGETALVKAFALQGYTFANWTEDGVIVSTSANYSFKAAKNRTLVANYLSSTGVTVNASAAPGAGGTVTGDGAYALGDTVTVSAVANANYGFVNWTENGLIVGTTPDYTFTADGNHSLVAHFASAIVVDAGASPDVGGTVDGAGTYGSGAIATLTATANPGFGFINWTDGGKVVSTSTTYSFTVTVPRTLVANFGAGPHTITTTASPADEGTTSGDGAYADGTSATVIAKPAAGYSFISWTEGGSVVSTNATYTFPSDADHDLVANFGVRIKGTPSVAAGGTVSGDGPFAVGDGVAITATPNAGYVFVSWNENGVPVSNWQTYYFIESTNRNLVAKFVPARHITTQSSSDSKGDSHGGIYEDGGTATVVAAPKTGHAFVNWTENGTEVSKSQSYSFSAGSDRTLTANFMDDVMTVTYDFDTATEALSVGQVTSFDQSSGGVSGQFSSPLAEGSFSVQNDASMGWVISKFSGNYVVGSGMVPLEIRFSRPVTSVTLNFGTLDFQEVISPSTVRLTAFKDSTANDPVGTVSAQGVYSGVDPVPLGTLTFKSPKTFDIVRIEVPAGTADFMVDDVTITAVPKLDTSDSTPGSLDIKWPAPAPGWILQENTTLDPAGWVNSAEAINTANGSHKVSVPKQSGRKFYRLVHP